MLSKGKNNVDWQRITIRGHLQFTCCASDNKRTNSTRGTDGLISKAPQSQVLGGEEGLSADKGHVPYKRGYKATLFQVSAPSWFYLV